MTEYKEILKFWFPNDNFNKFWFSADKNIDEYIQTNFFEFMKKIISTEDLSYVSEDELLAKIIVLDQFTRNIYRNTSLAYHYDYLAIKLANEYFKLNCDEKHTFNKIIFALMPFRHSENIKDQQFVLDYLDNSNLDKDSSIYKKFLRASLISYNTILQHGFFPKRLAFKLD